MADDLTRILTDRKMYGGKGAKISSPPLKPGNIDLYAQPVVKNPRGGTSTVYSFSANFDGKEHLLPMVMPDGRLLSEEDAIREFHRTGKHLGIFDSPSAATAYAEQLHNDYEAGKYSQRPSIPAAATRGMMPSSTIEGQLLSRLK